MTKLRKSLPQQVYNVNQQYIIIIIIIIKLVDLPH